MSAGQLELDLAELVTPDYAPEATNAEKWLAFHRHNPHVADALESLAAQWLAHNPRASAKALVERLRWESGVRTEGGAYQFDNRHTAFYARLLVTRHPEWATCFNLRKAEADETSEIDWTRFARAAS